MNPDDYDFQNEKQKIEFIIHNRIDFMFYCPKCGTSYLYTMSALKCCKGDCFEQANYFLKEERADFRMRQEKGD